MAPLREKCEILRRLHQGPDVLVLVNVWDAISARIVEELGFPAVATSSAAVANSLGFPDGERISRSAMLQVVARIAERVKVPVSADMEAGYAGTPEEMADTVRELVSAGAAGFNLEDGKDRETRITDIGLQVEKIRAAQEAGARANVPVVINARTDAYWLKDGSDTAARLQETVRRAQAYRAAGADCIFVPGLQNEEHILQLLNESPGPINILGTPGAPPLPRLRDLGVRRVSLGSGPYRAALGLLRKIARETREAGTYQTIAEYGIPFVEANQLLER